MLASASKPIKNIPIRLTLMVVRQCAFATSPLLSDEALADLENGREDALRF